MAVVSASDSARLDDLQLYEVTDAMRMLRLSKTVIYERSVPDGFAQSSKVVRGAYPPQPSVTTSLYWKGSPQDDKTSQPRRWWPALG